MAKSRLKEKKVLVIRSTPKNSLVIHFKIITRIVYFSSTRMGKSHLKFKMMNSLVSETNLVSHLSVLHQGVSGGLMELDTCPQMERYIRVCVYLNESKFVLSFCLHVCPY